MEPVRDVKIDVSWDRGRYFSDYASDLAPQLPQLPHRGAYPVRRGRRSLQAAHQPVQLESAQGPVDSDLLLTIEYPRDQKPDIDAHVNGFVNDVSTWLGWGRDQIDRFNLTLETEAERTILARRQRVEERDAHLAASTIPLRHAGADGKTYIPDVIVRRPAPSLPATRADEEPPKLQPTLEAKVFEHILEVIRMHGRQMEQNPGAYAQLGEEDRRQQILATLNTHYAGRASAEAFNHQGKTDILIRFEDRNLFICECKFWDGPEGFKDTIDQLFRYVGWRDTKLAIVMFIRERGLSTILKRARTVLGAHEQFVAWGQAATETELRATMHWPGDDERLADLNVFLVHTPAKR